MTEFMDEESHDVPTTDVCAVSKGADAERPAPGLRLAGLAARAADVAGRSNATAALGIAPVPALVNP